MTARLSWLAKHFTGELITPADIQYDSSRAIFNGMIDRRPSLILQPKSLEDVRQAIIFARENGGPFAVRGGGHNVAGYAICDDGIVLDFSLMRSITVDPDARRAVAEGGSTWGEFDAATGLYGLACTGGIISDTGVAGLTLGGGLGWLMGKYGLTCDNVCSFEVVLADGRHVTASLNQEPELFWALRGGGGNFGAVVNFEFELHPVGKVYAGSLVYPIDRYFEALERFSVVGRAAPDELTLDVVLMTSADGEKIVSVDACYVGDSAAGSRATSGLEPTNGIGSVLADSRKLQNYTEWQQALNDPFRRGRRSYWKSLYIDRMDRGFFDLCKEAIVSAPSPYTMLTFDHVHGAASRVPVRETSFAHRDKMFLFLVNTNWDDPDDDEKNILWARQVFDSARAYGSDSVYVNYLSNEGQERVRSAFPPGTYARLSRVKAQYDPENFFRANQNVRAP